MSAVLVERGGGVADENPLPPKKQQFRRQIGKSRLWSCKPVRFTKSLNGADCIEIADLGRWADDAVLEVAVK